jgi:hypothetical protein
VERFVGELLQAKVKKDKSGTGRFGRAMSKRGFSRDIVSYDNVKAVRDGLKKLGYLDHTRGYPAAPSPKRPCLQMLDHLTISIIRHRPTYRNFHHQISGFTNAGDSQISINRAMCG